MFTGEPVCTYIMDKYRNKNTGETYELKIIFKDFRNLVEYSRMFKKYKNEFNKFLDDYYIKE